MNKDELIKNIYKLLLVYEQESFDNYNSYLSKLIILLSGFEREQFFCKYIMMLRGLQKVGSFIEHCEVKQIVLDMANDIERYYKEV